MVTGNNLFFSGVLFVGSTDSFVLIVFEQNVVFAVYSQTLIQHYGNILPVDWSAKTRLTK
jgi:hypothetical protein